MSFLATLRFPIALAIGLFLNGLMFWTLYELTDVAFDLEVREATRIEFTRTRRDTQTETRREEKVEREPPPKSPDLPQLSRSCRFPTPTSTPTSFRWRQASTPLAR
jgi:hypothetical protein